MKKILVLLVVILLLLGGVALFLKSGDDQVVDIMSEPESSSGEVEWWAQQGTQVANLEDVSGNASTGTGYARRSEEGLLHMVRAKLADPEGENFYEGWLVRKTPILEFFSTGEMKLNTDGEYVLDFRSELAREGFDEVVITLETIRDDIPEQHILEGVLSEAVAEKYQLSEIAQHETRSDCWLAIEGKVYDVTEFVAGGLHPGKLAILLGCGKDATELFNTRPMGSGTAHSTTARKILPEYEIGILAN